MSTQFSQDEVSHLADLAHITLRDEEKIRLTQDLNVINDAISNLQDVKNSDVEPTLHPIALSNVFREDTPATFDNDLLKIEDAIKGGPCTENNQFIAPQILGEE